MEHDVMIKALNGPGSKTGNAVRLLAPLTGSGTPKEDADYLCQVYMDTETRKIYTAVDVGTKAEKIKNGEEGDSNDWVEVVLASS